MVDYAIGLDYGTLSVRGILIDSKKGNVFGVETYEYPHSVITDKLPETQKFLDDYWCLQHTDDYLEGLEYVVKSLISQGEQKQISRKDIKSLGIDFTCCTVLPVDESGEPLLKKEAFKKEPHAWVKLWKHHAAQKQADHINQVALDRKEPWLPYYGGKISSEWLFPKLLQILEEAPAVYQEMDYFIEAGDWLVWQLTGQQKRSKSCAGYKALYQEELGGYPSVDFFESVHPDFKDVISEKIHPDVYDIGTKAGHLKKEMAKTLGLSEETVIAVNNIDAHVCVASTGVTKANVMLNIIGTSSCDILLTNEKKVIPGIAGLVKDGAVKGLQAYETGQNAVGDIFSWFVETQVPKNYFSQAKENNQTIYQYLESLAAKLQPGQSGLIALDWWNGNRSTLMNAQLTGLVVGMTLKTKPEEIYRALIEATAFGKRMIVENFESNDIPIDNLVFCGGLPHKNKLLNQIYSDVIKKTVLISNELETGAKSAAIFSLLARDEEKTLETIIHSMSLDDYSEKYEVNQENAAVYDELFDVYEKLVNQFGRQTDLMAKLQTIKQKRR